MDYNSDFMKNNQEIKSIIPAPKCFHHSLSQFNKLKKNKSKSKTISLKKNIFYLKNSRNKSNSKNHLNIKNIQFPDFYINSNNKINNIYLSNSSQNFYISSNTERSIYNKNFFEEINNFIMNNKFNKNKLFIRKIDLELNDIMKNKKQNYNVNLRTFNNFAKSQSKIKFEFNTINHPKASNINENYKKEIEKKNNHIIKKNKSEKIMNKFSRKVLYLNPKNNFVSEQNIINLIQKEEKILDSNIHKSFLNEYKREKYNKELLPLLKESSSHKINKYIPFKLEKKKDNKYIFQDLSLNNSHKKKEKEINKDKEKPKVDKYTTISSSSINNFIKNVPEKTKNNHKKDFIELKTGYDQYYEEYEYIDNVDNYNEKKDNNNNNNFINIINNYSFKNNNYDYNNKINEATNTIQNNNLKDETKEIEQDKFNKYLNKKKINNIKINDKKLTENERVLTSPQKMKQKKISKNNDLFGYLFNYNFNSANFFEQLLEEEKKEIEESNENIKEKEKSPKEKKGKKNRTKNSKTKQDKNKNIFNNNHTVNNQIMERNHKFWNIKSFNKNKVKDIKKYYHLKNLKKEINEGIISQKIKNIIKEEKDIDNIEEREEANKKALNTIDYNKSNILSTIEENQNTIKLFYNNLISNDDKGKAEIKEEIDKSPKKGMIKRAKSKNYNLLYFNNNNKEKEKEESSSINQKGNPFKKTPLIRLNTRNYNINKLNANQNKPKNNASKSGIKTENKEDIKDYYFEDCEEEEEENNENENDQVKIFKSKYPLIEKITFNELAFLDDKKISVKEKLKLIKIYKDKAVQNLYIIVKENLEEKKDLTLCIETLIKFLMIKSYKKYVNIMKILTAKSRNFSGLNTSPANPHDIKDEEIIKYIYRLFIEESSPYYINIKKNTNNINSTISSSFFNKFNLGKLSHKKYKFMNQMRDSGKKFRPKNPEKKYNIKKSNILNKLKKSLNDEENKKDNKNFKQFMNEEMSNDKKMQNYLAQEINLTNELKYQIGITHNERSKERFRTLLKQIESMKKENIKNYLQIFNENYNFYQGEIKELIKDREKEERINNFLHELIDDRNNISKRKEILKKRLKLGEYRLESLLSDDCSKQS